MKKIISTFVVACASIVFAPAASLTQNLSIETLAVINHVNIHDGVRYGAGLDLGLKANSFVTAHVRAVAYEEDNWRGSAVDTGSLLIEARLLDSANHKLSLSAIGGVNRHFGDDDWGFSVGPRIKYSLTKNISLVVEEQVEALIKGNQNLTTFAGISFGF